MDFNRAKVLDRNFLEFLEEWDRSHLDGGSAGPTPGDILGPSRSLAGEDLLALFESMVVSRHLDFVAREMRAREEGFYTIGSSGHEGNGMVGRITRPTDPAFLHYRSGAFMAERYRNDPKADIIRDTTLGLAASSQDPVAGGRHKVWGSKSLWVPPQTSTIASHLPKAVGAAMALGRAPRLHHELPIPRDSIIICSFGDASVNHAVAQTAFNAASWATYQKVPLPILFVCEDNGIGVSVHTPRGWIETSMSRRPGIRYVRADGLDPVRGWDAVVEAVSLCREERVPVFLHLEVVRLLGHAGSDPEWEYHDEAYIEENEARDPLVQTARRILQFGLLDSSEVRARYEAIRTRVAEAAKAAAKAPKLEGAEEILSGLASVSPTAVAEEAKRLPDPEARIEVFGSNERLPENQPPRHLAMLLNFGLHDLMTLYPEALLFGEDVARKGGVYHVTADLSRRFGVGRVFNTLLDETMILGMAIGAAHLGYLPFPEIQYLAYLHNAEDQIRGEACSLQYFSRSAYRNPMVVRVASWAYQKGFGGHFHNDNSIAVLRDIPGLIIASPSRGDDAVGMLRTCAALARVDGRVVIFLEPIALYMTKDLHEKGDGAWSFSYPEPGTAVPFQQGRVYGEADADLTVFSWSNGLYLSLRAARQLQEEHGIRTRVVDLRWLKPLNGAFLLQEAEATGRVLVVDEGRATGGVGEEIITLLAEHGREDLRLCRVSGEDGYIPLGPSALDLLPTEAKIVQAARGLLGKG